jgi:hypothetical protein
MSTFFPALAETDKIGYLRPDGMRREMSNRRLLPASMAREFLTSLSYDEKIHYTTTNDAIDQIATPVPLMPPIERVFVDCGAFHYVDKPDPIFKKKGFVTAMSTWEEYESRHLIHEDINSFLLCSPDHIIPPDTKEEKAKQRTEWTLFHAKDFLDFSKQDPRVIPVGVVHGTTTVERAEMTEALLGMGYEHIAFGGLVPLARNEKTVLSHLTGTDDPYTHGILPDSPLGLVKSAGAKSHAFGLNSPDWYRWWKRMDVDSFDGAKLSQEGAASGIIWLEQEVEGTPTSAKEMYQRRAIVNMKHREMVGEEGHRHLVWSDDGDDGDLLIDNPISRYFLSARCTSHKCKHGPLVHPPDPRVTGSIEHNMGRTLLNAWTFESLMSKIDDLYDLAKVSEEDDILRKHWSSIEVKA